MRIDFGPGIEWGGLSQAQCELMARDDRHPLAYRVYFSALWKANQIGHAEFRMGELATILAGEGGVIPSRQSVTNAVGRAKALDLIGHDSTVRCLTLPHRHFQKGGRGGRKCSVHGDATPWARAS
ncbi:hypothetical protein [Streptomyces sp. CC228A]|uniref:hypothetical protein n=1 Tax=Streptomyces sp. CC228A TaxID=2898186 RepID=UPI001F236FEF|nr:hypothetical protein [Streptomyces sp. CC228A]